MPANPLLYMQACAHLVGFQGFTGRPLAAYGRRIQPFAFFWRPDVSASASSSAKV